MRALVTVNCDYCEKIFKKYNNSSKLNFCETACKAEWQKENLTKNNNPFFGRAHTDETKQKISKLNKGRLSGKKNPNWKRGFRTRKDGYLRTSKDEYLHRLAFEKAIGRKLKSDEIIHHKDRNPSNNDITNLELMTNSQHRKLHSKNQKRNTRGGFI